MSKSYFGRYFLYKLKHLKYLMIPFAILNFMTAVLPQIIMYNSIKSQTDYIGFDGFINVGFYFWDGADSVAFKVMGFFAAICAVMITVTTVRSVRIYHDRAAMDTLGCLPLSYRERFWGDLLSPVCANFISLIPFYCVSLIIESAAQPLIRYLDTSYSNYMYSLTRAMHNISTFTLLLIIAYLGIYAVTAFISSCCGKFGTAVGFSFVAMAVIPGIYTIYANYFYTNAIGADAYWEICSKVGMLPPFGAVFSIFMRKIDPFITYEQQNDFNYLINRPVCFIVPLLVIAAFLLGAYYIGKKRKSEKTGEGFVFKSVFYVLAMTLLVMVIGLVSFPSIISNAIGGAKTASLYIILPLAFLFYSALEISQNGGFKGFWKTVIRYAATVGACLAFMTVVKETGALGYYKALPSENNIREIRVSGEYFYSNYMETTEHVYKAPESVSTILSEHKKLLDGGGLTTGHKLFVTYVTKSGSEIRRGYTIEGADQPIRDFSYAVNSLQEFDPSVLGIIGNVDLDGWTAEFDIYGRNEEGLPEGDIRVEKLPELAVILRRDIENYYFDDSETGRSTVGNMIFENEHGEWSVYKILYTYEDTLAFLSDPSIYEEKENGEDKNTATSFHVTYIAGDSEDGLLSDISVTISADDTSGFAEDLWSYIEPTNNLNHNPPCFIITDDRGSKNYRIKYGFEYDAKKALLYLFRDSISTEE